MTGPRVQKINSKRAAELKVSYSFSIAPVCGARVQNLASNSRGGGGGAGGGNHLQGNNGRGGVQATSFGSNSTVYIPSTWTRLHSVSISFMRLQESTQAI